MHRTTYPKQYYFAEKQPTAHTGSLAGPLSGGNK
jgi:hypothetical protein